MNSTIVVVTSDPLGCVSVLTSVFLTAGVGVTSLASLLSGAMAAIRPASLSAEDDTGTDLFGFFGTAGCKELNEKKTKPIYSPFTEVVKNNNKKIQYCIVPEVPKLL